MRARPSERLVASLSLSRDLQGHREAVAGRSLPGAGRRVPAGRIWPDVVNSMAIVPPGGGPAAAEAGTAVDGAGQHVDVDEEDPAASAPRCTRAPSGTSGPRHGAVLGLLRAPTAAVWLGGVHAATAEPGCLFDAEETERSMAPMPGPGHAQRRSAPLTHRPRRAQRCSTIYPPTASASPATLGIDVLDELRGQTEPRARSPSPTSSDWMASS